MQVLNFSKPSKFILDVLFRSLFMYVGHKNYPAFDRCSVVIQNEWHNENVKDTLTPRSLDIRIFGIRAFDAIIRLLRSYSSIVCPCITMLLVKMLGEARPNHLPVFWKPRPLLLIAPPEVTEQSI
jgi:hypothetical protein